MTVFESVFVFAGVQRQQWTNILTILCLCAPSAHYKYCTVLAELHVIDS